ncbi:hypothetical protein [Burkholderia sp. AU28863]|uniref:hypothetical protein n=1 Tax=Burkholderia sp. AU28863 TaxID=2015352 RepID=UPI001178644D|nr:hypothetical protein [Burkholderia sp. AU28863]
MTRQILNSIARPGDRETHLRIGGARNACALPDAMAPRNTAFASDSIGPPSSAARVLRSSNEYRAAGRLTPEEGIEPLSDPQWIGG